MGYLIGGSGEEATQDIVASEKNKYSHLSNEDLLAARNQCVKDVTKFSNFQMARKIQLNSLYGALGNQYFRHFKVKNAEAITLTGQVAIRWIERKTNEYLNKLLGTQDKDYVVASDTDSIYLDLGPLVSHINHDGIESQRISDVLNQFCSDKIEPYINESYDELSDYLNCYEKTLVMKRECIAEKGIWTAKKRYILNVWDNEGVKYQEPKLKMMGIEAVRSSTPAPCRTYIKEALKLIMEGTEDEMIDYITTKRKEFRELPVENISFPRSANNISKYMDVSTLYKKGTPIQVRAAILFNHYIKLNNLENKYNYIADGEKIKFVMMMKPNPTGENVFGMINQFPHEVGLTKYVDYDTMFDKGFLEPLQSILDVIGWNTEKTTTLESFFT